MSNFRQNKLHLQISKESILGLLGSLISMWKGVPTQDDYHVIVKTVELSTMPNPALAKDLLERLRLATKVVVARRKWRVPVLKEFYPKNPGLLGLNVNSGQSIMIRLREGRDQFSFLPWHSLLGTLVHELTHNEVGEHSAEFYKLMETIYDEVEATCGEAGSLWGPKLPKYDFNGPSVKLGGGQLTKSTGIGKDNVRELAAEAAMRRMAGGGTNLGPRTLGGGSGSQATAGKSAKELFLEAEERRRAEGCNIVKGPVPGAVPSMPQNGSFNAGANSSSSSSSGGSAGSPLKSAVPTPLAQVWLCQVCFETNDSSTLVDPTCCAWCGCVLGSTLDGGSAGSGSSSSPGHRIGARTAGGAEVCIVDSSVEEVETFSLDGLCRRSLYEVRNCNCCAAYRAGSIAAGGSVDVINLLDQSPGGSGSNGASTRAVKAEAVAVTAGPSKKRRRERAEGTAQGAGPVCEKDVVVLLD